jgi:solute carrier family 34 (sodium-dependent phosphate cotransporter)
VGALFRTFTRTRNVGWMGETAPDREPDKSSGTDDISGESQAVSSSVAVDKPTADAADAEDIQLPVWTKALGWCGTAGLIYLLICAVSIISRGFAGLTGDAAHSMFAFAAIPWVGLSVGVLGTVLIQSSTTTTAIAVTAVGAGALPIRGAIPIILGANVGTTVTTTLVALTFIGSRAEFRRALGASTIHDFYNWLALLIFFPLELIWHPLERISAALTNALYGTGWLPDPARFNFVRAATRPVEDGVIKATSHLSSTLGPLFTIVIGAALILVAVRYLGKLLKLLMVGRARDILIKAVGRNAYLAMASGMGVTVLTQSSTITTSVLVPFAGAGILTPAQIYPVTVGANLGTTFTVVFAAFAVVGQDAKIGLQAAFVHLLYNLFAIIVIYVIPVLRPVPLFCAQTLARIAAEHKWVIAVWLLTVFIALPALVIILVGVL